MKRLNNYFTDHFYSGVDFDDPEFGFTEEDKFSEKANHHIQLQYLVTFLLIYSREITKGFSRL